MLNERNIVMCLLPILSDNENRKKKPCTARIQTCAPYRQMSMSSDRLRNFAPLQFVLLLYFCIVFRIHRVMPPEYTRNTASKFFQCIPNIYNSFICCMFQSCGNNNSLLQHEKHTERSAHRTHIKSQLISVNRGLK